MGLKVYLVGMLLADLIAWVSFGAILIYLEPNADGLFVLILFYLTLFIAVSGVLFLIGFFIRRLSHKRGIVMSQANISFRQGILLSIILIGALILQGQRALVWWNLLALVVAAGIAEGWMTRKQKNF